MTILIAVGSGKVNVPNIVGHDRRARPRRRCARRTSRSVRPRRSRVDPKGKIASQIPAAERGRQGAARRSTSSIPTRPTPANKKKAGGQEEGAGKGRAARAPGGGGRRREAPRTSSSRRSARTTRSTPTPRSSATSASSPWSSSSSTTPSRARRSRPTRPAAPRSANGAKVKVLVSVGQPQVVYTNGKDILRLNGANAAEARPGGDEPGGRRRTRPGPPTASTSPTPPTGA